MRMVIAAVVTLAACSEEGAHLTLSAPNGPPAAASYRVVLATPDVVPVIDGQRLAPSGLATETVTYYLQRTDAGVMVGNVEHADGFTILVEPNPAITDTAFIPFVILYDASERIVGIGTFHGSDQSPDPSPILVQRGEVDKYTLDVEPVADVDDGVATDPGDALQVTCARGDQPWQSGIVWRPLVGGERRIVLPDDPSSTDATQRPLDLDCDGAVVAADASSADCDDTRARFHAGATERCDGEDTNCDSAQYMAMPCTDSTVCQAPGTSGVALCDDATGTLGACQSDARCACAAGTTGCSKCVLEFQHGTNSGELDPCEPQEGVVSTLNRCEVGTCTVFVAGTHGGWQAFVAQNSQAQPGLMATNVKGSFTLRVKGPSSEMVPINASVGTVDIVIAPDNGTPALLLSIDLELGTAVSACSGGGPFPMSCTVQ